MTHKRHHKLQRITITCIGIAMLPLFWGCSRDDLRKIINKWGNKGHEKPAVYHEFEGYSPGAKHARKIEDFNRYHYYISPDKEELLDSDPQVYYTTYEVEEYETSDAPLLFDEEQYWKDHPLQTEQENTNTNNH